MRKVKEVTITTEGRDKGKVFVIREVPASKAEEWGFRAMEAVAKSGASIPDGLIQAGLAGVVAMGFQAVFGAPYALMGPLQDEMFLACVSFMPDPKRPEILRGAGTKNGEDADGIKPVAPLIEDDIMEVKTRLLLRSEVWEIHTGFSVAAYLSQKWQSGVAALAALSSSDTSTSDPSSEPSSPAGSQPTES